MKSLAQAKQQNKEGALKILSPTLFLFTFCEDHVNLTWQCLFLDLFTRFIDCFAAYSCEHATPSFLLENRIQAQSGQFCSVCNRVMAVMTKTLRKGLYFRFRAHCLAFAVKLFTVTSITCEL
jgi:hypothetical protein